MATTTKIVADASEVVITDNGDGTFTCSVCGETLINKVKAMHPSRHLPLTCEFCGETVAGAVGYQTHLHKHRLNSKLQARLLDLIKEFPGLAPAKYAKMLNMNARTLTGPSRILVEKGLITKTGKTLTTRWHPVEGATLPMGEYMSKREMKREIAREKKEQEARAMIKANGRRVTAKMAEVPEGIIPGDDSVQFIATEKGNFLLLNGRLYRATLEPVE